MNLRIRRNQSWLILALKNMSQLAICLRCGFGGGWLKLLAGVIFCSGIALAQEGKAVRAPFFQGEVLPEPPQQNAEWQHSDDALSNAAAALFEQGLANPLGLEYREIEIAVGNPWDGGGSVTQTHGWILPKDGKDGQFAVAWDGLVYPVVRVGNPADLHQDWAPDAKMPEADHWSFKSDLFPTSYASPSAVKLVLLLRLGEVEAAARISKLVEAQIKGDPYLSLAKDWTWFLFERAVCAHERGDDRLALADARFLTKVKPLIEAEAKRRGFELANDYSSSVPGRKWPYLPFLEQLPALLTDSERRVANRENPSLSKNSIAALIEDLQNVDARQWGQPGGVDLGRDARVQVLVKRGHEIVEPLLETMESDTRLTRAVSFGRDFARQRHLISVSEAARAAVEELLRVRFKASDSTKALADQIRAYWTKLGALTDEERFYTTLQDDQAGADQWLQAAANIVQPTDVESLGGWTTIPDRKTGQKILFRGESLRDGRTPSVSQLLGQRSDDIAAIRTGSTQDHFLYVNAGQMALYLATWDKTAAIPTLKKRLMRAWSIGSKPQDILAFNGNPVEHFGTIIAKMTLARASSGDATAYDEYAAWIRKAELKGISFGCDELQKPLVEAASRPSIEGAIDYLFNDPQSPWANVMAQRNGFWLGSFWETMLPNTAGFRRQALRGLADKTLAGTITFNPREDWRINGEAQIQMGGTRMGFRGSNRDPDIPPPGQTCSFRVCDAYAHFYSQYQKGPDFQIFWPETKRDAGVLACRNWLEAKK